MGVLRFFVRLLAGVAWFVATAMLTSITSSLWAPELERVGELRLVVRICMATRNVMKIGNRFSDESARRLYVRPATEAH